MRRGLSRSNAIVLSLSLLGALLVGLPSMLLALRDYPLYEARLQVRVLADPRIGDEAAIERAGEQGDNFIDTELVTLNSPTLRDQVAARQDDPRLQITAVRVGLSNVVELTVRSSRRDVAASVEEVLDLYVEGRRAALQARIKGTGNEVQRQLAAANAAIVALGGDDSITAQLQRAALTTELTRLFQQRNTLQLASEASERLVQVVTTENPEPRQVIDPVRSGIVGALAGAVGGFAVGLGLLRLRPRARGLEDLPATTAEVALPTLHRVRGDRLAEAAGRACAPYVSALTKTGSRFGSPPLVVLGPTHGCGVTFVAVGLAVASARRQPTVLVAAADALDGGAWRLLGFRSSPAADEARKGVPTRFPGLTYLAPIDPAAEDPLLELESRIGSGSLLSHTLPAGAAIVVDSPPLDVSSAGLELARQTRSALLVGAADRSSPVELDAAARSLRRVGAVLSGVLLSEVDRRWLRRRRKR